MLFPNRTSMATLCLVLAAGTGPAWAHGTGGAAHTATSIRAPSLTSPSNPSGGTATLARSGQRGSSGNLFGAPASALPQSETLPSTEPSCVGEVSANCAAIEESQFTVSGGDPNPIRTPPVATSIPPTPAAPSIPEPLAQPGPLLEQSGGGSGVVVTAGGGPTLTDCMALWEPAVHMSKDLWKDVCKRTMNGINEPQMALDSIDPGYAPQHAHGARSGL